MAEVPADGTDIQIELGDVSYKAAEQKRRPEDDRSLAVVPYGQPDSSGTAIYIHEHALRNIEAHAASDQSVELGGALLGGVFRHGQAQFVEITDSIIATKAEHAHAEITFTHDTWVEIEAERERRGAKAQIVGWYHTHPDIGVFFSEPDTFIQRNFFKEPWQVAFVIDPVRGDRGFFQVRGNSLLQAPGFYVFAERRRRKQLEAYVRQLEVSVHRIREPATALFAPPARGERGGAGSSVGMTLWLLLLTMTLAAVIIGEAITGRPLLAPAPQPQSAAAVKM